MTQHHSSWNVGRAGGRCHSCNAELPPRTECWAALCDRPLEQLSPTEKAAEKAEHPGGKGDPKKKSDKPEEKPELSPFIRIDFCEKCWSEGKRPAPPLTVFSYWKTIVPIPEQKKKLLVDDSVLIDVFTRMEDKKEPQEIRFRFVLALILMRKRLLKYEATDPTPIVAPTDPSPGAGQTPDPSPKPETWRMIPRGSDKPVEVINPHLDANQISEVSQQLSAILAEEV